MKIIGLSKLNLEPEQEAYLLECLKAGKSWFVIRRRSDGRCVQASGETRDRVQRTFDGWPGTSLVEIKDGKVFWHR